MTIAILMVLVGPGLAYLVITAGLVKAWAHRTSAAGETASADDAISVLKPLYGAEPGLEENLLSFINQAYPRFQIVFGLQSPDDLALGVAQRLKAAHPDRQIDIVVDTRRHGANGKITNLINLFPAARHDILVLADSDMRVGPDYLSVLARELGAPGIGAVTCLYKGRPQPGLASALGASFINHHFIPQVLLSRRLGSEEGCFGATIALHRQTLEKIGNFEALADILADDHEIGQRVRALGLSVALSSVLVDDVVAEADLGQLIRHELRWARTIRLANPAGFAASVITLPVAMATLGLIISGGAAPALALFALAFGARIWFQRRIDQLLDLGPSPWWLVPVRDVLTFAMIVASFLGQRVSWRGAEFQVGRDGSLLVKEDKSP